MFFYAVFHVGMLQMPHQNVCGGANFILGHRDMVLPVQLPLFGFGQLALEYIAIGLGPPGGLIPKSELIHRLWR